MYATGTFNGEKPLRQKVKHNKGYDVWLYIFFGVEAFF